MGKLFLFSDTSLARIVEISCNALNGGLSNQGQKLQKVVTKILNFAQFETQLLEIYYVMQESKPGNIYLSKKIQFSAQGRSG